MIQTLIHSQPGCHDSRAYRWNPGTQSNGTGEGEKKTQCQKSSIAPVLPQELSVVSA